MIWGDERWIGVTYEPAWSYEGSDEFSIVAGGAHGDGPVAPLAIVARTIDSSGATCGYSPPTSVGQPIDVQLTCDDAEGDPYIATVIKQPTHGVTGAPTV